MRQLITTLALATGLALGLPAHANGLHVGNDQCRVGTDYDVLVQPAGIRFERSSGTPAQVFMHDGALEVDGRSIAVSPADARRLREYEARCAACCRKSHRSRAMAWTSASTR